MTDAVIDVRTCTGFYQKLAAYIRKSFAPQEIQGAIQREFPMAKCPEKGAIGALLVQKATWVAFAQLHTRSDLERLWLLEQRRRWLATNNRTTSQSMPTDEEFLARLNGLIDEPAPQTQVRRHGARPRGIRG